MKFNFEKILYWSFVLCGGKFYLDWLLPTNYASKNPLINLLFGGKKRHIFTWDYNKRIMFSYFAGTGHLILAIMYIPTG